MHIFRILGRFQKRSIISKKLQSRIEDYHQKLYSFNKDHIEKLYKQLQNIANEHNINMETRCVEEQVNSDNNSIFHILAQHGTPRLLILATEIYSTSLITHKNNLQKDALQLAPENSFMRAILLNKVNSNLSDDGPDDYLDYQDFLDANRNDINSDNDSDADCYWIRWK